MELSTLILGATMTILPLVAAGLLTAMVVLERPRQLSPAAAFAGREPGRGKARPRRAGGGKRAKA